MFIFNTEKKLDKLCSKSAQYLLTRDRRYGFVKVCFFPFHISVVWPRERCQFLVLDRIHHFEFERNLGFEFIVGRLSLDVRL